MTRVMKRGGVTTITLNRPQQRNALNEDVIRRLADATAEAAADPDCRCLVVKGQGDHFCAGRDIGEADKSMTLSQVMEYDQLWADVIGSIRTMGAPSVAVVRGFAVAGGFTLSMSCDFVLAERSARFGALEMKGGFPAAVNTAVLSHLVGPRQSLELLLSAGTFTAEQLNDMGLINRLATNEDELAALEKEFVEDLKALDPLAVKLTKETHRAVRRASMEEALITAKQLNSLLMTSGKIDEAADRYAKDKAERRRR
ncbi:MAG: hypothetical protein CMM59_03610 [Rhodospirillaceae bacterium]|nr:hypothetical protein [Rhodospirillaceae bacterium]